MMDGYDSNCGREGKGREGVEKGTKGREEKRREVRGREGKEREGIEMLL